MFEHIFIFLSETFSHFRNTEHIHVNYFVNNYPNFYNTILTTRIHEKYRDIELGMLQHQWCSLEFRTVHFKNTNRKCSIPEALSRLDNFSRKTARRRHREKVSLQVHLEGRASRGRRKSQRVNEFRLVKAKESEERLCNRRLWYLVDKLHAFTTSVVPSTLLFNCDEFMPRTCEANLA